MKWHLNAIEIFQRLLVPLLSRVTQPVEVSQHPACSFQKFKRASSKPVFPFRLWEFPKKWPSAGHTFSGYLYQRDLPEAPSSTPTSLWAPLSSDPAFKHYVDYLLFGETCRVPQVSDSQHLLNAFDTPSPLPSPVWGWFHGALRVTPFMMRKLTP